MLFEMGIISARKVGVLLALFWMGTLAYFWLPDHIPDFLDLRSKSKPHDRIRAELVAAESKFGLPKMEQMRNVSSSAKSSDVVHVCITSDKNTLGGMVTLMNSIVSNTKHAVKFHLVVDVESKNHLSVWLGSSHLKDANFEIKVFPSKWVDGKIKIRGGREELGSPLNYARYYLPRLFPTLRERIVFIDDDCIVHGDIHELYSMKIKKGDLAAFSEESLGKRQSRLSNKYADFLDLKNAHVKEMNVDPNAASFNSGVFVTNLADWVTNNITAKLEYWMELNTREEVYGNEKGGGGSQPPMMLAFYDKYSTIDPMWHVRHLGLTAGTSYSKKFLESAKLIHWNGQFKPWGRVAQHKELWDRYYIPDPANIFQPVRRKG